MLSQNFTQLIGYLGSNPEIIQTLDLRKFAKVQLATHERIKTADGAFKTQTVWHQVYFNGKLSEFAQAHLKKGDRIQVLGKLEYRQWTDTSTGAHHHAAIVIAKEMLKISASNAKAADVESIEASESSES